LPFDPPLLEGADVEVSPLPGVPAAQDDRTIANIENMLINRNFVFIFDLYSLIVLQD